MASCRRPLADNPERLHAPAHGLFVPVEKHWLNSISSLDLDVVTRDEIVRFCAHQDDVRWIVHTRRGDGSGLQVVVFSSGARVHGPGLNVSTSNATLVPVSDVDDCIRFLQGT